MAKKQSQPQWQPITFLPQFSVMITQWLDDVENSYQTLSQARLRPHVLDDATIARVFTVYTEQKNDLWLYEEQLSRWSTMNLFTDQAKTVAGLQIKMKKITSILDAILSLAEELKEHTIEKVLAKNPAELAMDVLLGKRKL